MYLDLHLGGIEREALVMILKGCKQVLHLDVSYCFGFLYNDEQILKLASHIPAFMCQDSVHFLY